MAAAAMALLVVLFAPGLAEARRRLVVLEFTGPKASDFQADVEKMLKKGNSLVPAKKWDAAAEKLGATKVNEKNVKKVAKKLSVDGVIVGRVEKRGSRYILHLQLREGRSGKTVAAPDIVERDEGLSVDGRDTIKQELLPIIDDLPAAGGEDEDEDEDEDEEDEEDVKPKGKTKAKGKTKVADAGKGKGKGKTKGKAKPVEDEDDIEDEDEDDDRVAARGGDEDDGDDEDEDEDVGDGDDEDDDLSVGGKVNLSNPRKRAMDVSAGLSFTGRKLSFTPALP
jgi:hypothetical protein